MLSEIRPQRSRLHTAKSKGSPRQKRAVKLAVATQKRNKTVLMKDAQGRDSLYRVMGRGRGGKRNIYDIKKIWTLSKDTHSTVGVHWLSGAVTKASAERSKVFRRVAEERIRRQALKGK